jgi:hypothetical protein
MDENLDHLCRQAAEDCPVRIYKKDWSKIANALRRYVAIIIHIRKHNGEVLRIVIFRIYWK